LKDSCDNFIGLPISPSALASLKQSVESVLYQTAASGVIKAGGDVEVVKDPADPSAIHIEMTIQPTFELSYMQLKMQVTSGYMGSEESVGQIEFKFVESEKPWR